MKMKVKIHLYFSLYVSKPPNARVLLIKKDLAREVWENVLCVTVCYQALLSSIAWFLAACQNYEHSDLRLLTMGIRKVKYKTHSLFMQIVFFSIYI